MLYISPDVREYLSNRLKVGDKKVNIRVEVDKQVFVPYLSTEIDKVRFKSLPNEPVIINNSSPNISSASSMRSPLFDVSLNELKSKITSDFMMQEVNGKQRLHPISKVYRDHKGIDFAGNTGDKVCAVSDGVITVGYSPSGYGNYIDLTHANGIRTMYAHLDSLAEGIKTGSKVTQGQVIGYVGSTGASTGPHLHFEVMKIVDRVVRWQDPNEYLWGDENIQDIIEIPCEGVGYPEHSDIPLRYDAVSDAGYITMVPVNTEISIVGKVGDFYRVVYNLQGGYVYGKDIRVTSWVQRPGDAGGDITDPISSRFDRIKLAAYNEAERVGFDYLFLMAICWHETQFGTLGWGREEKGSYILGYGAYSDTEADPKYNGIETQMYYGAKRFEDAMRSKGFKVNSYDDVHYFWTGGDLGNYQWAVDTNWPTGVWNAYQNILSNTTNFNSYNLTIGDVETVPQGDFLPSSDTGLVLTGTIINNAVNIRERSTALSKSIKNVNAGFQVFVLGVEGEWTKIQFGESAQGYVQSMYLKLNDSPISNDYIAERVFEEDFDTYSTYKVPPRYFSQDPGQRWLVIGSGKSNILSCTTTSEVGVKNFVQFNVTILNAGKLTLKYLTELADQNKFRVFINNRLVLSRSGTTTTTQSLNIPLSAGTHVIKLERQRNVDGMDSVSIDDIVVYDYLWRGSNTDTENLASKYINSTAKRVVRVTSDSCIVYKDTSEIDSYNMINRGTTIDFDSNEGEHRKVVLDTGETGYVRANQTEVVAMEESMVISTGGFVYEKTLVLDTVVSVDVDFKYEMKSGEATVVIDNKNGFYSPDYKANNFPELNLKSSPFADVLDDEVIGVLTENTPIRIYIGYGDNPPRRFTGLIDSVDLDSESKRMTIRCTDMMKKVNDYCLFEELRYPPVDDGTAWLASSVIQGVANKAGLTGWRVLNEDLNYPDLVIDESYYTDLRPKSGTFVVMENDRPVVKNIKSLPIEDGYMNPSIWRSSGWAQGTMLSDIIDEVSQDIGYWCRCDRYGTFRAGIVSPSEIPSYTFRDTKNIISVSKTINYTNTRNHLIIHGGNKSEHFFDSDLWKSCKGVRKTAKMSVEWATSYGQKQVVASKMFQDMRMSSRTLQVAVEGNPYLDILDRVTVESVDTAVKADFIVKGIRDSFSEKSGYVTVLDLTWLGE